MALEFVISATPLEKQVPGQLPGNPFTGIEKLTTVLPSLAFLPHAIF
ncbi:single-stranded DNA-specific exonuclease [Moorella thermoacetica Y72]|uniref:Single-stranded DNA-specific exonuclease n=1 Tax=Moorella thermoacetica Y72 TaxID=1325331 RepID=A0A0S6UDA8_NEOTH|nr:single-stranded DNA-specific exonuclease [Moorella thermoacetica Y72]